MTLKEYRILKNLSLREVEQITGVSNSYLSQLENEKIKKPSIFIIHKLAKCYDIPFQKLLESLNINIEIDEKQKQQIMTMQGSDIIIGLSGEERNELEKYLGYLRWKNRQGKHKKVVFKSLNAFD